MRVQVILKESISDLGQVGDVVNVAAGYARNYLFPKGLAVKKTAGHMKHMEIEKFSRLKKEAKVIESFQELAHKISAGVYSIACKTGEEDKMFGSVTSLDIATLLSSQGFDIEKKNIKLDQPIHELGVHKVGVKVHPEVIAQIEISVVKEED